MARRKFGRKFARRPRNKMRRFKRRGVKVMSALSPIPARQIVKMKYSTSFATAIGTSYNQRINLNSIFDPDQTGVGHQPYGTDQLAALYNRYRVISCSYVLTAFSAASGIRFGAVPANEYKTFTTVAELAENPRAQVRVQYPGATPQTIKGKVYMPALTGRGKTEYMSDDRYQAQFGANPQEVMALNCAALDLAEAGIGCNWTAILEYTVEVFDPHPLAQS